MLPENKNNFHWNSIILISDKLKCNFQEDFCSWQCTESNEKHSKFYFQRINSKELSEQQIIGPELSHLAEKDDYFAFISASNTETFGQIANLENAKLQSSSCLTFWFNFQVSNS